MKHILMVDDNEVNLMCADQALNRKYKFSRALTGGEGFAFLEHTRPDLILLDIRLPDINGYDWMEQLKNEEKYSDIPIIFLTGETNSKSETRGLQMGAMDYIKKPFLADVLLSRVTKALEWEEGRKKLESIAHQDSLTTLWNRRYMEEYIEKGDRKLQKGVFMLLDMDNFKQINDNYGHLMGDNVLVAFADAMKACAGPGNSVCRIGGDEFVVYLNGAPTEDQIRVIARNLISAIEYEVNRLLDFSDQVKVSVSIGIAVKPEDGKGFKSLYNSADKALYYVKQNGKRGYHFYNETTPSAITLEDENHLIDLLNLRRLIQESGSTNGAYQVEYSGFKRIHRFVSRYVERTGQDAQMVLFNINADDALKSSSEAGEKMEQFMGELEEAVSSSLRRGDVGTRFSTYQYVVILMNASVENGKKAAERILEKCKKINQEQDYHISFEMQSVHKLPVKAEHS